METWQRKVDADSHEAESALKGSFGQVTKEVFPCLQANRNVDDLKTGRMLGRGIGTQAPSTRNGTSVAASVRSRKDPATGSMTPVDDQRSIKDSGKFIRPIR